MYTEFEDERLNREVLTEDIDFIADAESFLAKRTDKTYKTNEDIYDAFMEHMRFQDTNEVTAVRDLMYAQEADEDSKAEFGRLMSVFDRMEGEINLDMVGDYLEAGVTAPSTWLGIVTGGAGKLSALAGKQAAQIGMRAVTGEVLKSAAKGAAVEGVIGTGQGAAQESARVETGVQDEFTGVRTASTGALSAIGGALPAGLAGLQQTVGFTGRGGARKAKALQEAGEAAETAAQESAKAEVKKQFNRIRSKTRVEKTKTEILGDKVDEVRKAYRQLQGQKDALDTEKVAAGKELLKDLSTTEQLLVRLDDETLDQVTAAALELGTKLKTKPGKRITEAVARGLADGEITSESVQQILKKYNLTTDQFSYIYMAELSDAGRKLGQASRMAKKSRNDPTKIADRDNMQRQLNNLQGAVEGLLDSTVGGVTKDEAERIAKSAAQSDRLYKFFSELDRFRLASMTAQVATTVRNTAGGSMRVALDILDESFEIGFDAVGNIIRGQSPKEAFKDPLAISKNLLFNQNEAKVVRGLFEKHMPVEAERFYSQFFDNLDTVTTLGSTGPLTKMGAKLNTLNRLSDNIFKQAVFSGKLDQLVRKQRRAQNKAGGLAETIAEGEFKNIDPDLMQEAIDMSLDFVYQKYPKGKDKISRLGQGIISAHRNYPFVVSSFIPFPRYVINQLSVVTQHTPLLAMAANKMMGKTAVTPETLAKQTTGLAMYGSFYALRSNQPEENEWYEFTTDGGKTMDLRATLGPIAPFMWAADIGARESKGLIQKNLVQNGKDLVQMLGGPQFRAGTGLYALDQMWNDLVSEEGEPGLKSQKIAARFVGDMANTFTLPAATIRDLVSLEDADKRMLDESAYTNFLDILLARAGRSLPDFGEADEAEPRFDITQEEELRYIDPLERQLFGVSKRAPKNDFQKELGRLRITSYDIYKPTPFGYEDRLIRREAARRLTPEMTAFMRSEEYQSLPEETKRDMLINASQSIMSDIRANVREQLLDTTQIKETEAKYNAQFMYETLPSAIKKGATAAYKKQYGEAPSDDYLKFMKEFMPTYKAARKQMSFSKGGAVLDLFGGAKKQADDVADDLDTVTDADYLSELDDELLDEMEGLTDFHFDSDIIDPMDLDPETRRALEGAGELALETLIGFIPVVGDVYDAYNVTDNLRQAKYVDAAIDAIGFVPFIGNALSKGVKVTLDMFKHSDPVIKKRALADFTREEGRLPDFADEADLERVVQSAAKQEKIVAGAAVSDTPPLFHGDSSFLGESLEPRNLKNPSKHYELKIDAMSTSRDPVMSVDQFASKSSRPDPIDAMYTVVPKRGIMAKQDLRPDQYDRLSSKEVTSPNIPTGAVESKLPTQLPKSRHLEAETIITDVEDVDIRKLADQPELANKVRKGVKTLEETRNLVAEAMDIGTEMASKKEAMEFYSKLAKAMKKAQGLGAFTSKAGARGSYDQHITAMAVEASDPRRGFDYYGLPQQIEKAARLLEGTQKGKMLDELLEGLFETSNAMFGYPTAGNVAKEYTEAKKKIFDVTERMNRGGLASRRA